MRLNRFMIRPLIEAGLREELNAGDTTGGFLVWDNDPLLTGQTYAKGSGSIERNLADGSLVRAAPPTHAGSAAPRGARIRSACGFRRARRASRAGTSSGPSTSVFVSSRRSASSACRYAVPSPLHHQRADRDGHDRRPKEATPVSHVMRDFMGLRASRGGLLRTEVELGAVVKQATCSGPLHAIFACLRCSL